MLVGYQGRQKKVKFLMSETMFLLENVIFLKPLRLVLERFKHKETTGLPLRP